MQLRKTADGELNKVPLITIKNSQWHRRFVSKRWRHERMREDEAGKRAKLESDGMRELKSELVSYFNDQAAHVLQLRTCRRRPTLWQATVFLFDGLEFRLREAKGARPN
jgi:hypothetical protein